MAQNDSSRKQLNRNGLVVVLPENAQALARADSIVMQKQQQLVVALVQADNDVPLALFSLRERLFAALLALRRALRQNLVAVRTGAALAQLLLEFGFKGRRDGVFQPLRLL